MRQTLPEAAVSQPTPVQPRAVPMSSQQSEEVPKVEASFSLLVKAKFSKLSDELAGVANSVENASSGEGLARGKPLSKPCSRMDLYKVSRMMYNFASDALDGSLRDRDVHEPESVTIPTFMLQRFGDGCASADHDRILPRLIRFLSQ